MKKTSILVDGGFYLKRAKNMWGQKDPEKRAIELMSYCKAHIEKENAELYRIYYYDCEPISKKAYHPLHNRTFDQSKEPQYGWKKDFFAALAKKRKVAIRMGEELEGSCEYVLKREAGRALSCKKKTVAQLTDDDYILDVQQKGVDVRIGLDLALLAHEKFVDQIVLITGDSDFVPAAKYARRHGIDFILDPMWHNIRPELGVHVDGLCTPWAKPNSKRQHPLSQ